MARNHACFSLTDWCLDPRSPIKREGHPPGYTLAVNAETPLTMVFCPFCGDRIADGERGAPRAHPNCSHLRTLSRAPGSSVVYVPEYRQFMLAGSGSMKIRLFFCPLCGGKIRWRKGDTDRFYENPPAELADLAKRFEGITTVARALRRLGAPDTDLGPVSDYCYFNGKRLQIEVKRTLFYNNLVRKAIVGVIESPDGRVDIRFYPRQKQPGKERRGTR